MGKRVNIKNEEDTMIAIAQVKQRVSSVALRLRRYKKRCNQFRQNKLFEKSTQATYQEIRGNKIDVSMNPTKEDLEEYWGNILRTQSDHNDKCDERIKQR